MRASGSHDVVLTDCLVPEDALIALGPWGSGRRCFWGQFERTMGLVGAFLGIAAARAAIVALVTTRRKGTSGRTSPSAIPSSIPLQKLRSTWRPPAPCSAARRPGRYVVSAVPPRAAYRSTRSISR